MTTLIRLHPISALFFSFTFLFVIHVHAAAQITQDGVLTDDTTWTLTDSPVTVTDSLTIAEGATLTIDPGVEVRGRNLPRFWKNDPDQVIENPIGGSL